MKSLETKHIKRITITVVTFLLAVLVLVMLVASLPGCSSGKSGDISEAKELMTEGDGYMEQYESLSTGFGPGDDEQPPEGRPEEAPQDGDMGEQPDESEMEEMMAEMEARTEEMEEYLGKAKASYEKILTLSGADDYKEYAEKMLEVVSAYEEQLNRREEMAGEMPDGSSPPENPPDMSNGQPGTLPSGPQGSMPTEMSEENGRMGPGNQEVEQLKEEAEKIKEEKNL